MGNVRHLTRAPIREAVLDVQLTGFDAELKSLFELTSPFVSTGWRFQELKNYEAIIGPVDESDQSGLRVHSASSDVEGYGALSADQAKVVQFRRNRATVSRVKKYLHWEDLQELAEDAFSAYFRLPGTEDKKISRIGVRFINRIPPLSRFNGYDEMLERPPLALDAPGLEGGRVTNFLRRHVIEGLRDGFSANLTIGTVKPEPGETIRQTKALVVDVDVYKACVLSPDLESLRSSFVVMRELKNNLFFGSLKDELLEEFA